MCCSSAAFYSAKIIALDYLSNSVKVVVCWLGVTYSTKLVYNTIQKVLVTVLWLLLW